MLRAELAIAHIRAGRMVILVDDEDRENEGDLVIAAEKCRPEDINFMACHARGLICLSITAEQVQRLGLPMMATNNQSLYQTAFTVSIEARTGVTTGISAADRAHTVQVAINPQATPRDVVAPGHMFPLRARDGGVLERVGQTEGSVDLARLAGLNPAGVICEIIRDDGTMARLPDLIAFGEKHGILVVTVADLIKYRLRNERIVVAESSGSLEVPGLGRWQARLYSTFGSSALHLALVYGEPGAGPTLARVQAAPPGWSFLGAETSKLARSARAAMEAIQREGAGAVVLMHAAASDASLLRASFERELAGASAAPTQAQADALRDLGAGCQILRDLGMSELRLLSASDRPIVGIEAYGLRVVERVALA
jgi:3,4-dihydroxy 2-butanone 4-phosphate synthase/GTP cyclohydrolase II